MLVIWDVIMLIMTSQYQTIEDKDQFILLLLLMTWHYK